MRIQRVMESERMGRAQAEHLIHNTDNDRSGYLKTYYKVNWQDPNLYSLIINTEKLGIDGGADCIVAAVKAMFGE
jgi:cytidylate kinase